jgi:hypothetical protein
VKWPVFLNRFGLEGNGEFAVPRWLVILSIVAVVALIAGFVAFGGGNMGR